MTKNEIASKLAEINSLRTSDAQSYVDDVFKIIEEELAAKGVVQILGFGSFFIQKPPMKITEKGIIENTKKRGRVVFKAGKMLSDKLAER